MDSSTNGPFAITAWVTLKFQKERTISGYGQQMRMYWTSYEEQLKSGDTPMVTNLLRYEMYHTASALAGSYENGNETSVPTKSGVFIKYISATNQLHTEYWSLMFDK